MCISLLGLDIAGLESGGGLESSVGGGADLDDEGLSSEECQQLTRLENVSLHYYDTN